MKNNERVCYNCGKMPSNKQRAQIKAALKLFEESFMNWLNDRPGNIAPQPEEFGLVPWQVEPVIKRCIVRQAPWNN